MLEQELAGVGDALDKAVRVHEGAVKRISTGKGNLLAGSSACASLAPTARSSCRWRSCWKRENENENGAE